MAIPQNIKDKLQAFRAEFGPPLLNALNVYRNTHGKAFQGVTLGPWPDNGDDATYDETVKPTDRDHSWEDLFALTGMSMPVSNRKGQLSIDEYVGDGYEGIVFSVFLKHNGERWMWRRHDYRWTETSPGTWEYVHYKKQDHSDSQCIDSEVVFSDGAP